MLALSRGARSATSGGLWWDPVKKVFRLWYEAGWKLWGQVPVVPSNTGLIAAQRALPSVFQSIFSFIFLFLSCLLS